MSDFKFPCPKCGQSILCDTSNAGMNVACPSCNTNITVPKPPEPEIVPGKLSIRPSAPHVPSQPAPGTANAPKPTSWGGQKMAPPPKKKAAWIIPVVICAVLGVLAAGWFLIGAPMVQKHQEEEKQKQEEAERQAAEQARAAAEAAKPKPKAFWSLDPSKAEIPEIPASGKLHALNFKVETVQFQSGSLILQQNSGSNLRFTIGVPVKSIESAAGKSFDYMPNDTNHTSLIVLDWRADPSKPRGESRFTKGYLMKLQFGELDNGSVAGGIFLSLPDAEQSFVAGTFVIPPPVIPGQQKPPARPPPQFHPKKKG